jgi:parvulin-like peptidyl-prolyl isomerase
MTVQDFLLPAAVDSADAGKRVSALRAGASPESLALESSGRVNDGAEFYFAAKLHLQDALFEAARKMHAGEVSDPIPQADGVHILIMQHNQPPLPVRYEDAEDRVLRDYLADKVAHLQASNERFLSKRADIRIAPGLR